MSFSCPFFLDKFSHLVTKFSALKYVTSIENLDSDVIIPRE